MTMALTQVSDDGLTNTGVTAATYGSSSAIPSLTIDAKGRVTSATTNSVTQIGGSNGVDFNDNVKARFGTSQDLEIYHDGNNSYIKDTGTGSLKIATNQLQVKNAADNEVMISANQDGEVQLCFNGIGKLNTKSDGVNITGELECDSADIAGNVRINRLVVDDDGSDDPTLSVRGDDGSPWGLVVGNDTYSANSAHGYKIYQDNSGNIHQQWRGDGEFTNFYLNAANGSLSQQVFHVDTNRQVFLKWQGNERLKTSSSGVDITGTLSGNGSGLTNTGGFKSMQVFTSTGTSTWTKPSGINTVKVYVTGGGGGGGPTNNDDMSNGGGAGGTAIEIIDVSSVSSVTVTVGSGGTGAPNDTTNNSSTGGTSSFGSYCSATGGGRFNTNWALGGIGGVATGGSINISGSDGIGGLIDTTGNYQAAGSGGASFWGQGGRGGIRHSTNAGRNGIAYGSGGGGGADSEGGRNGAAGIVVVEEYA